MSSTTSHGSARERKQVTFGGTKAIAGGAKAIAVTSSGGAKAIAEPREQKSRRFLEAHPKDDARFHDPLAASPNRPFPSTSSEAEAAMRSKAFPTSSTWNFVVLALLATLQRSPKSACQDCQLKASTTGISRNSCVSTLSIL